MTLKHLALAASSTLALSLAAAPAAAQMEPEECGTVNLEQVNWPGVTAKTETAAWILEQLGYETDIITASVPIMFNSLSNAERDAFLGLWLPTQRSMFAEYGKDGSIDIVTKNLEEAKYTVAVSQAAHDAGVQHFSDLDDHADQFGGTIYGIESGNDGNEIILSMIEDDAYGLGDWNMKPSSTAGMLTEVKRRHRNDKWTAWLGWRPHPMNVNIDMAFLEGGADYWGPNQGQSNVYTLTREGYAWNCPNVGQFLESYTFELAEQDKMVDYVQNEGMEYEAAGQQMMKDKPELIDRWTAGGTYQITGVKTRDGDPAGEAIRNALGM